MTPETWTHELGRRVRTLFVLKMLANLSGIAAFFYAYFWIMRHPLSAATVIPVTWIDDLVPFSPQSFFLYASLWVYVALGSLFTKDGRELAAWAAACFSMIIVGLGIFMALPTKVPDFAVDWSQYPSLAFLKGVDASGNALPSLHAAFAVFTAVVLHGQLTAVRAPRAALACSVLWCLGIVYSAMATRQHLALDIIAGAVLAGAVSIAYLAVGRAFNTAQEES
ncbi:MAG TPA: phosphatase PAP2 family protein [Burkholderiales bacterium]|nr:phosphatase PAP2 family protein [Burkholderiales bacterium]